MSSEMLMFIVKSVVVALSVMYSDSAIPRLDATNVIMSPAGPSAVTHVVRGTQ